MAAIWPSLWHPPHPRGTTSKCGICSITRRRVANFCGLTKPSLAFARGHQTSGIVTTRRHFYLRHNGKQTLQLNAADSESEQRRRVASICGVEFSEHAVPIERQAGSFRLWGWVAEPTFSRSQADLQYFFVNGRVIRDKLVTHAIRQAYRDVLFHGRHPAFVLFFELDPAGVDVNVHPTKHEVRFRDSRGVHDFLFGTLSRSLADVRPGRPAAPTAEFPQESMADQLGIGLATGGLPNQRSPASNPAGVYAGVTSGRPSSAVAAAFGGWPRREDTPLPEGESDDVPPLGFAVAQLHGVYILAENQQGLVLVDMHAAHERITYERLKRARDGSGITRQPLLVPVTLAVSSREAAIAAEQADDLASLGLSIEAVGRSVVCRELPAALKDADVEALVRDVLGDLWNLAPVIALPVHSMSCCRRWRATPRFAPTDD